MANRKVKDWNNARRKIKAYFQSINVTRCEICGSDFGLSFAHSRKRRNISGDELFEVALLCIEPCHRQLELLPEAEMTLKIKEIIAFRGINV